MLNISRFFFNVCQTQILVSIIPSFYHSENMKLRRKQKEGSTVASVQDMLVPSSVLMESTLRYQNIMMGSCMIFFLNKNTTSTQNQKDVKDLKKCKYIYSFLSEITLNMCTSNVQIKLLVYIYIYRDMSTYESNVNIYFSFFRRGFHRSSINFFAAVRRNVRMISLPMHKKSKMNTDKYFPPDVS